MGLPTDLQILFDLIKNLCESAQIFLNLREKIIREFVAEKTLA